ncbi:hypothetical protein SAMN05192529_12457 [Arachidicoccus rhizosphaerae]|uniref:Uncharacterized protein n=1 Tax=Arachidicoccus rhizosphaerae TaxID=551991 RepID=A0A1H4BUV2_9BACT|nr:hypothetical protein [Arachidicoccus rhizosphaerae]SEA51936.1 hypothetical protein SAMN05192529_12457 [Arachidicoccus rhizosphaerae]
MERLINKIRQLDWPELQIVGNNISIENTNIILLETDENNIATLRLIYRKSDEDDGVSFNNSYSNLLRLVFPTDFNAEEILTKELKLRQYQQLDEVFKFNSNHINTIQITNEVESYEISNHIVRIAPATIVEIINNYNSFYDEAKSYSKKYVLYKATEFQRSYFGIEKEKKTTTNKGEFNFVIDRFNLQTKRTKSDFEKYLNENDLYALQDLTLKLIQKEVYGAEFLTRLNDYFIKIRLEEIIKLGREILSLKSTNLKTAAARNIISKIETDARKIKQLESVWQKYFEKYLSFLIFSYQLVRPPLNRTIFSKLII